MSNHTMTTKLGATSVSLVLLTLGGCKAIQPKPQCKAQPADYMAKYETDHVATDDCQNLTGELLHFQYYRPAPGDASGRPSVAIEPASVADAISAGEGGGLMDGMGIMADENAKSDHAYFSLGKYTTVEPDDNDICSAPKLNVTNIHVDMIPADPMMPMSMPIDAVDLTYTWSNLKMLVRPDSNGVYFSADLVRKEGMCEVKYKVTGVNGAPADGSTSVAYCGDAQVPVLDDMGNPVKDDKGNAETMPDTTMGMPDDTKCDRTKNKNGLPHNLTFKCDKDTLMCFVDQAFPKTVAPVTNPD
jgi:hypothetical protein